MHISCNGLHAMEFLLLFVMMMMMMTTEANEIVKLNNSVTESGPV